VDRLVGVVMGAVMLVGVVASNVYATPSTASGYSDYGAKQQFQLAKAEFLANKLLFLNEKQQFQEAKADRRAGGISKSEFLAAKIDFVGAKKTFATAKAEWLGVKQEYRGGGTSAVPIPATFLLFGGGFAGLVTWRWKAERKG
jgi:hypothetical protein